MNSLVMDVVVWLMILLLVVEKMPVFCITLKIINP